MPNFLKKILAHKKLEVEHFQRKVSLKDLQKKINDLEPPQDFLKNFKAKTINIIAEMKAKSPAVGIILNDYCPIEIAKKYLAGGAAALSILTDRNFFGGKREDVFAVKKEVCLPILRKDFVLNEYQIYESRAIGADALLLIARILDSYQVKDYLALAKELKLMSILEIHNDEEYQKVLTQNINILGINNRNLDNLLTSIETTVQILNLHKNINIPVISESGFNSHEQLFKLQNSGVDGFLIGEALLKSQNPQTELAKLRGE